MSTTNNGGPAFPITEFRAVHQQAMDAIAGVEGTDARDKIYTETAARAAAGMTLRDYFAAKAMQAMVAAEFSGAVGFNSWAEQAYKMADAMLKARSA